MFEGFLEIVGLSKLVNKINRTETQTNGLTQKRKNWVSLYSRPKQRTPKLF